MMENDELLRRVEDLSARCEKSGEISSSFFLTPAQQAAVSKWAQYGTECKLILSGGAQACERKAAFFLPYYVDEQTFDPGEHICALRIRAGFGEPGHRDYLGAVLGLGIRREWIGDIWIDGDTAYLFCLPTVQSLLLSSLDKVGRYGVKVAAVELSAVPEPERKTKKVTFTVKSMRFDAVVAGMFALSRTEAAKMIASGLASLNYEECQKSDAGVNEGDVISLRGCGKGAVLLQGGMSRKGRLFIETEIYQ